MPCNALDRFQSLINLHYYWRSVSILGTLLAPLWNMHQLPVLSKSKFKNLAHRSGRLPEDLRKTYAHLQIYMYVYTYLLTFASCLKHTSRHVEALFTSPEWSKDTSTYASIYQKSDTGSLWSKMNWTRLEVYNRHLLHINIDSMICNEAILNIHTHYCVVCESGTWRILALD